MNNLCIVSGLYSSLVQFVQSVNLAACTKSSADAVGLLKLKILLVQLSVSINIHTCAWQSQVENYIFLRS